MSLRAQKVLNQARNFKDLMRKIFKNRKAAVGMVLLIFFAFLAVLGPLFVRDDPINPGSVPVGRMPVSHVTSYPSWYRDFTGNPAFTNNLYALDDAKFSDPKGLSMWQNSTTSSGITVSYNSETGYTDPQYKVREEGAVQINFTQAGNATLTANFKYPYATPPPEYRTELFYSVQTQNQTGQTGNTTLYAYLIRNFIRQDGTVGQDVFPASPAVPLSTTNASFTLIFSRVISSVNPDMITQYSHQFQKPPTEAIFATPGTYSFELVIQFEGDPASSGNPTVLLGNVNLLVYGNSFGLLGSDNQARDLFSQLIAGTQVSFILGLVTAILSVGIGLIVGLVAGYVGGATDEVLMRINDMLLVIPTLPLMIVLVFVLGQSLLNLIVVIGFLGWMGFARTVRSAILSLKERSFIEAVRSSGGGRFYIIRKHLIPNVFPLIYITLAMSVPGAIVTEAALSFLGLGPQDVMSWGRILYQFEESGQVAAGAFTYWYWTIPPGVFIALLSLSFVLIGFALDEILNPRLRER